MAKRTDHVEDARDFEARAREEAKARNRTDSTGKHVTLDARHVAEQDAIGDGLRFAAGDYLVKIVRCYAVDGDAEIWLPETSVTYFVCEMEAIGWDETQWAGSPSPCRACWVNRLRFNGMAQLKVFLIEAFGISKSEHGEITEAICEKIVGAENPLAGVRLWLRVNSPKASGYMHHEWHRVG